MKLHQLIETEKKRPPKTLWFNDYVQWVHDIKLRFPEAEAHRSEENEEIVALDQSGKECYGVWHHTKNSGVSYATARPLQSVIHPRITIKKLGT